MAQKTLNVGIIEMKRNTIDNLLAINQAKDIIKDHPDVDVIMTPEYAFFDYILETSYIKLEKSGGIYTLNTTDGDAKIIKALQEFLTFSKDNNVQLILGTIPLKLDVDLSVYPNLEATLVFNSTLIINNKGEIIDYDLKVRGSDWVVGKRYPAFKYITPSDYKSSDGYISQDLGTTYLVADNIDLKAKDAVKLTNSTTKVRTITSKTGGVFKYATMICAERHSHEMLDAYKDEKVDVLFYQEHEGYYWFKDLMETIQTGTPVNEIVITNTDPKIRQAGYGLRALKRDLFNDFISRNIITEKTYLIASDTKNGMAGAIRYDFKKVDNLDYSKKYTYVKIPEPNSSTLSVDNNTIFNTSISLYPNPVSNILSIDSKNNTALTSYTVYSINGRLLKHAKINNANTSVDISGFNQGIYLLELRGSNSERIIRKIVKK